MSGEAKYKKYFDENGGTHPDTGNALPEWKDLSSSEQTQWGVLASDEEGDGGGNISPPPGGPGQGPGGD